MVQQVGEAYKKRDKVSKDFSYLFKEAVDTMKRKAAQHLKKWLEKFNLAAKKKERGI